MDSDGEDGRRCLELFEEGTKEEIPVFLRIEKKDRKVFYLDFF